MLKPTAQIVADEADSRFVDVWVTWTGAELDRPCTYGISLSPALAERFARAVEAGAAFGPARLAHDVRGASYVQADCLVSGRRANADLRRLGF